MLYPFNYRAIKNRQTRRLFYGPDGVLSSLDQFLGLLGIGSITRCLGSHASDTSPPDLVALLTERFDLTGLDVGMDITRQSITQTLANRIHNHFTIKITSNNIDNERKLLRSKPPKVKVRTNKRIIPQ